MPKLCDVKRRPGEEEHGVEHQEHLNGFDFSPGDDVHGPAHRSPVSADPPDVAHHPLVEGHDEQRRHQEPKEKMRDGVRQAIPAVRQKEVAVVLWRRRSVEEQTRRYERGVKDPRRQNHSFGFLARHFKAQRIHNGVETIHADGQKHVDLDAGAQVLEVSHDFARGRGQRPVADANLQEN